MLSEERRELILDRLRREGKVVAAELSSALGVSPDTVRRDLRDLDEAGLLRRVHGGALPAAVGARPYSVRLEQAPEAKSAIAHATSRLFRDGQVIVLDSGTTTLEVARALPPELEATVITNSPPIATALADHPTVEVAVLGGMLMKEGNALIGAATVNALQSVRADVLVLGVCSLHPEVGITVLDLEESYVKRAMIANAAEVVAVSAADKLGSAAPYVIAPLAELTYLVTEAGASPQQIDGFRSAGTEVILA
jgi:DeoR/GlpR family transcriptional regulator of sugar metabolism